jgi:hypothetical protein
MEKMYINVQFVLHCLALDPDSGYTTGNFFNLDPVRFRIHNPGLKIEMRNFVRLVFKCTGNE